MNTTFSLSVRTSEMIPQSWLLTDKQEPAPCTNMSPYFRLHDGSVRPGGVGKWKLRKFPYSFMSARNGQSHILVYIGPCLLPQIALSWAPRLKQALYIPIPESPHYTKEDTFSTAILINFRMSYTNEKYSFINKHAQHLLQNGKINHFMF